jgi:photosystem II stability/assembly factor-like uncharacterized protein
VTWPDWGWRQVASSADGTKLAAAAFYGNITPDFETFYTPPGAILISTNSGLNWTQSSAPETFWTAVACSADGTTLVAASEGNPAGTSGPIYTSTNTGATWTPSGDQFEELSAIACSADGRILVAANASLGDGRIFISKGGGPWAITSAPAGAWVSLTSSSDGSKLLAVKYISRSFPGAPYWVSTDSGVTWAATTAPSGFTEIASSADGRLSVAAVYQDVQLAGIYVSTNAWASSLITGATGNAGEFWLALASLAEGGRLLALSSDGGIYLTMGTGTAWTLVPAPDESWPPWRVPRMGLSSRRREITSWPEILAFTLGRQSQPSP